MDGMCLEGEPDCRIARVVPAHLPPHSPRPMLVFLWRTAGPDLPFQSASPTAHSLLCCTLGLILAHLPTVFLWRNMGGALLTLLPAVTYSLKVGGGRERWGRVGAARGWVDGWGCGAPRSRWAGWWRAVQGGGQGDLLRRRCKGDSLQGVG